MAATTAARWAPRSSRAARLPSLAINRNKRSLALNLRSEDGRRVFKALAERADVVVENFRPGTLERLGLGYPQLSEINPALIYCSISGFGQTGALPG